MAERKTLDLDALNLARAEKRGVVEAPIVRLGGKEYTLPAVLPASFMVVLGKIQQKELSYLDQALKDIFGDEAAEVLEKMDAEDLGIFINEVPTLYVSAEAGESQGSLI